MDVRISWTELDVLATPFNVAVSFAEFDVQGTPFDVRVSWAEFDAAASVQAPPTAARAPTYDSSARKKKRHTLHAEGGKFIAQVEAVSEAEEEEIILAVLLEVAGYVIH